MLVSSYSPNFEYLLLAIALGAIIGLGNEYRMSHGVKLFVGLRTSMFISILGFIFASLYLMFNDISLIITAAAAAIIISTAIYVLKTKITKAPGATTYSSSMILFFIGMVTGLGFYQYGIILTVLVAAISFYKQEMMSFIHKIKRKELIAGINILIIALVILPLLPSSDIGPYNFFNPLNFWIIVVTISIVFFVQYLLLKHTNDGLFLSSIISSAVTGTAVTFTLVHFADKIKKAAKSVTYNIMFSANIPMIFIQGIAFVYFVTRSNSVIYYMAPIAGVSVLLMIAMFFLTRDKKAVRIKGPSNPLPFFQALQFAVFFFIILTASKLINAIAPNYLPLTMFLSGLVNVAGSSLSLGLLFLDGNISGQYLALLLGLVMGASVIEKGFIALLSKNKIVRNTVFAYSWIIGLILIASTVWFFEYGI